MHRHTRQVVKRPKRHISYKKTNRKGGALPFDTSRCERIFKEFRETYLKNVECNNLPVMKQTLCKWKRNRMFATCKRDLFKKFNDDYVLFVMNHVDLSKELSLKDIEKTIQLKQSKMEFLQKAMERFRTYYLFLCGSDSDQQCQALLSSFQSLESFFQDLIKQHFKTSIDEQTKITPSQVEELNNLLGKLPINDQLSLQNNNVCVIPIS